MVYRDPTVNNDRRVLLIGKQFGLDGNIMKNINDQLKHGPGGEWSLLQSSYRRFIAMLKRLRELTPSVIRYRATPSKNDACCIFPECDEHGVLTGPHRRLRHRRNLDVSNYWGRLQRSGLEDRYEQYQYQEERRMNEMQLSPRRMYGGPSNYR